MNHEMIRFKSLPVQFRMVIGYLRKNPREKSDNCKAKNE
jgi:hypothetical protein